MPSGNVTDRKPIYRIIDLWRKIVPGNAVGTSKCNPEPLLKRVRNNNIMTFIWEHKMGCICFLEFVLLMLDVFDRFK